MTDIFPVYCQMDNCTDTVTLLIRNTFQLHQLGIAGSNGSAIYLCDDTFTADFLHIRYSALINGLAIRFLKAAADRMG